MPVHSPLRRWSAVTLLSIVGSVVVGSVIAGCAGDAGSSDEPTRAYTLRLRVDDSDDHYRYVARDPIDLRVGDEVTFELENTGSSIHDLQVVAPDGTPVGVASAAAPGSATAVTVRFDVPGYYRLNCLVDDHLTVHRMQSIVEVLDV